MARWRRMHASLLVRREVRQLSTTALALWIMLWVEAADDEGRLWWRPRAAWGAFFCEREGVTEEGIRMAAEEMVTAGMLRLYEVGGQQLAELQHWDRPRDPTPSDLPAPPWWTEPGCAPAAKPRRPGRPKKELL